jgi:3',5'-cyclic AMP phosphodiesterase CpdA
MTDIHLEPMEKAVTGFDCAIAHTNALKPDFVITGGDLIDDALAQTFERSDSLYKLYNQTIEKLQMPVYNTIGNHEVFGLYKRSGIDPSHTEYGKKMFENRVGKPYQSFDHKGWHFMLLDGIGFTEDRQYFGYIDPEQMEWIQNDLAKVDKKTPIAISIHIPFYSVRAQIDNSPTAANSRGIVITNAKDVMKLFENHNLRIVVSGHLHWNEEIIYNNAHHINVGAVSASWWNGPNKGVAEGFAVFEMDGENFTWKYEGYGWHVQPTSDK